MFVIPNLIGGGAQKTVANLSLILKEYYDIYIVTFHESVEKYTYNGKYYCLNFNLTKNKLINKINLLRKIILLKKIKKEASIDVSISFLPEADVFNMLASIGEKRIISIRNNLSNAAYIKGRFKNLFMKSLSSCSKIVAITNGVREDMITNFKIDKNKITTIYNPAMTIKFSENKMINEKLFSTPTIITVGRLEHQKGQWHLIRAFKKVVEEYDNSMLLILGEGSLKKYLENLIKDLGLESNIKLLGFKENPYDYIKKSDIFVFPSLYEGLGNTLLEVLQLGIPIISTDCNFGPREILSPESDYKMRIYNSIDFSSDYGVLVPIFDGKLYNANDTLTKEELIMSSAILKVLKNSELRSKLSYKEKERAKHFSEKIIANEWRKVIDE